MTRQTHPPAQWVIVDDGSTDDTPAIAAAAARLHSWITVMPARPVGAHRTRGAPIVQAFNAGLAALHCAHAFVVKLDGDLLLPSHCFAWIAEIFERVPGSGHRPAERSSASMACGEQTMSLIHTVSAGPLKAYRRECLRGYRWAPAINGMGRH